MFEDLRAGWRCSVGDYDLGVVCGALGIAPEGISDIYENPGRGINNSTYVVEAGGRSYLYRIPGEGTELFCSRQREYEAYMQLREFRITDEIVYFEPEHGRKMSVYYPNSHVCGLDDEEELRLAMELIRRFHGLPVQFSFVDTPYDRLLRYTGEARAHGGEKYFPTGFEEQLRRMEERKEDFFCERSGFTPVHGDCLRHNILFPGGRPEPILIDWEFPCMSDPYCDIAAFCHDAELPEEFCLRLLGYYLGRPAERAEKRRLLLSCAVVAALWCSWSAFKAAVEEEKDFYIDYARMGCDYSVNSLACAGKYE